MFSVVIFALSLSRLVHGSELPACENFSREGFPADFAICWLNETNHSYFPKTLETLENPATYKFDQYGNILSGVLLDPEAETSELLLHNCKFYALINPLRDSPSQVKKIIRRNQMLADELWEKQAEMMNGLCGPRKNNQPLKAYFSKDENRYYFVPMARRGKLHFEEQEYPASHGTREVPKAAYKAAYDEARQKAAELSTTDLTIKIVNQDPGIDIGIVDGRAIIDMGDVDPNTLPIDIQAALAELKRRFYDSNWRNFMEQDERNAPAAPQNYKSVFCHDPKTGHFNYLGMVYTPPNQTGLTPGLAEIASRCPSRQVIMSATK